MDLGAAIKHSSANEKQSTGRIIEKQENVYSFGDLTPVVRLLRFYRRWNKACFRLLLASSLKMAATLAHISLRDLSSFFLAFVILSASSLPLSSSLFLSSSLSPFSNFSPLFSPYFSRAKQAKNGRETEIRGNCETKDACHPRVKRNCEQGEEFRRGTVVWEISRKISRSKVRTPVCQGESYPVFPTTKRSILSFASGTMACRVY